MTSKALLFTIVVALIATAALAQPPDSLWSRIYGGSLGDEDCRSLQQTSDGGYILAGLTTSFGAGGYDFWLVKTDTNGDSLWSRTFGGSGGEMCNSAQQTTDGGYILAGHTDTYGAGNQDFWLVKTDASGDSLWSRTFGGGAKEECLSVQQTSDGGYILAGSTVSFSAGQEDFWLVKTDANGDSLWSRTFGGTGGAYGERCQSVQQTSDGGYILAGFTQSFGVGTPSYFNYWLVKTDSSGDSLWSRAFGGSSHEMCRGVRQTADGGYILVGYTESYGAGGQDFWLVKTDADGNSLWSQTFGGSSDENCFSVRQTSDGGYILAGETRSFAAGDYDLWLVKTNQSGDSLWSRTFGGTARDKGKSVQQTSDGGYAFAGYTKSFGPGNSDVWLIRMEPEHCDSVTYIPWDYELASSEGGIATCIQLCHDNEGIHRVYIGPFPIYCFPYLGLELTLVDSGCDWDPPHCSGSECQPPSYWFWDPDGGFVLETVDSAFLAFDIWLPPEAQPGCVCVFMICVDGYCFPDCWLPVELASFTATPGDEQVTLEWSTASESDNDRFEILRDNCLVHLEPATNSPSGSSYSWTETRLDNGTTYEYTLVSVAFDGTREELASAFATPIAGPTAVTEYALHQNYPNPFNPETTIAFDLVDAGHVMLTVYDPLGREVATLVEGPLDAGCHTVTYRADDLPSGVYFCRFAAGDFTACRKMLLLK